MMTEAERSAILETEIQRWIANGYRLVARTPTTAQLVKPKSFNVMLAILGLLFLVVGLLIYLLVYASQSDAAMYLSVGEDGTVMRRASGTGTGGDDPTRWFCGDCGYRNHRQRTTCKRCRAARP